MRQIFLWEWLVSNSIGSWVIKAWWIEAEENQKKTRWFNFKKRYKQNFLHNILYCTHYSSSNTRCLLYSGRNESCFTDRHSSAGHNVYWHHWSVHIWCCTCWRLWWSNENCKTERQTGYVGVGFWRKYEFCVLIITFDYWSSLHDYITLILSDCKGVL